MNERIEELAFEAWRLASDEVAHFKRMHNQPTMSHDEVMDVFEQKFAELIVRECAQFVEDKYDFLGEEIIVKEEMLEHFGVKE